MTQWIEVKVRYERLTENGATATVTEQFLVDALSCTEAEARIVEEVSPFVNEEFNVLSVNKTKISEVFRSTDAAADKFYKVKVNFITLDEKTGAEKRSGTYILVQASEFTDAFTGFVKGMQGSMADYEIESIAETKIVDAYERRVPKEAAATQVVKKVANDKKARQAVKKFHDIIPDGMTVSVAVLGSDGTEIVPETVVVDKSKPRSDDD